MRNIFIAILLFIGSVSAQTYHPANLKVVDSIKVGTSTNSAWFTNLFVESLKMTTSGRPYTLDGNPQYQTLDSLLSFEVSAHDKDTFIVETAIGFDNEATNYQLRYLEGLTYPSITEGTQALSSTDSNAFKSLKVYYNAPDDNTNIAVRLFSEFGIESVFNSDTTQIDSTSSDTSFYYVDQDGGNNSNTGRSIGQAWATIEYTMANMVIPVSDTTLVISLDPSDTWSTTGKFQFENSGTADDARIIWDGTRSEWGHPGDTAVLFATDGGSGLVRFVTCEYVTFQNIIVDCNEQTIYGVVVGGNDTYFGSPAQNNENHITIQNCEIKDVGSTTSGWAPGVLLRCDEDTVHDITIHNNYIHDIAAHGITVYATRLTEGGSADAISRYINISNNTIRRVRIETDFTGNGIHITRQADSIIIEYNNVILNNARPAISIDPYRESGENLEVDRVTVRYNWLENTGDALATLYFQPEVAMTYSFDFDYYGNVVIAGGVTSNKGVTFIEGASDFSGSTINFYNNTVISTDDPAFHETYTGTININNNIFYNTASRSSAYIYLSSGGTNNHTNNLYYSNMGIGDVWINQGGVDYTGANITNSEATAQNTDPTFTVDFSNLNLQTGSPAIDNGTAITGYTEDRQGVAVVNPPNIGQSETTEDP